MVGNNKHQEPNNELQDRINKDDLGRIFVVNLECIRDDFWFVARTKEGTYICSDRDWETFGKKIDILLFME